MIIARLMIVFWQIVNLIITMDKLSPICTRLLLVVNEITVIDTRQGLFQDFVQEGANT
jgi:hypothetical protein